jgi:XTP/dITP diphosphohydrolase
VSSDALGCTGLAAPRAPIYVATSNPGKLREMHALFADTEFELVLDPRYVSPAEGDCSYAANAALKARSLHAALASRRCRADVLADDSGLEVLALDGRPGVTTAEYGGAGASWSQRRRALLAELAAAATPDRRARFVCALHFIAADGRELGSFATVDGTIAPDERGELGFSFDPIFFYPPAGKTFAELSDEQKNQVSHRAIAAAALVAAIDAAAVRLAPGE